MDLRIHGAEATEEEREAVDGMLGPPLTGWVGGARAEEGERTSHGGHDAREQRHLLLPTLHAVQERIGWISPGALNYVCLRLTIPPAEAYGVASFYALFALEPRAPTVVHVCNDIGCTCRGASGHGHALGRGRLRARHRGGRRRWRARGPRRGRRSAGPAARPAAARPKR